MLMASLWHSTTRHQSGRIDALSSPARARPATRTIRAPLAVPGIVCQTYVTLRAPGNKEVFGDTPVGTVLLEKI
jgi:hypothetical protein